MFIMKQIALFTTLLLFLLSGCSPRIGTMVTKTHTPLNQGSPIVVYHYQTDIPMGSESIGKVTISDTGFSINCDSLTVMNLIKGEARKIGGNAVCVVDHKKPSIWGSSCHQMTAIILNVTDFNQNPFPADDTVAQFEKIQQEKVKSLLPKFKIGANIGYGWRGAKLSNEIQADMRNYYKEMKSGLIWDGTFHYYFNDAYGIGLVYSAYNVENSIYAQHIETGETGMLKTKNSITFIGPVFATRNVSNNKKWIFNLSAGLGYMGYHSKETINNQYAKATGSTVGFQWSISEEYKLDDHWGIGIDLSMLSGLLNSVNSDINGNKSTFNFEKNKKEGLGQFRLSTGIRYYF